MTTPGLQRLLAVGTLLASIAVQGGVAMACERAKPEALAELASAEVIVLAQKDATTPPTSEKVQRYQVLEVLQVRSPKTIASWFELPLGKAELPHEAIFFRGAKDAACLWLPKSELKRVRAQLEQTRDGGK
jgi:hypothetical protein